MHKICTSCTAVWPYHLIQTWYLLWLLMIYNTDLKYENCSQDICIVGLTFHWKEKIANWFLQELLRCFLDSNYIKIRTST